MTTETVDPMERPEAKPSEINVFDYRKAARRRMWVCPGGGFEYLGRQGMARCTYWSSLAVPLVATLAALFPVALFIWATIGLIVLAVFFFVMEVTAGLTAWPPAEPEIRAFRPTGKLLALAGAVGLFAVVTLTSYGIIVVPDESMVPVLNEGQRVLYRKGGDTDDLKAGQLVLFQLDEKSKAAEPGLHTLGRILAVPGDTIAIGGSTFSYYINGQPVRAISERGEYSLAVSVPRMPTQTKIPEGCYFIVQESLDFGFDSRVLSYARSDRIISTRLYTFDGSIVPKPVE